MAATKGLEDEIHACPDNFRILEPAQTLKEAGLRRGVPGGHELRKPCLCVLGVTQNRISKELFGNMLPSVLDGFVLERDEEP
jgi:hypothetical protein